MKEERILILETGKNHIDLVDMLSRYSIQSENVSDISEALLRLESSGSHSMLMINTPSLDGKTREALRWMRKIHPFVSLILLTTTEDEPNALSLLLEGTVDQLAGAGRPGSILSAVKNEFHKRDLAREIQLVTQVLKRIKLAQSQNEKKTLEIEEIYNATIENLMTALDLRDVETYGHSMVVAKYSQTLAKMLGITDMPSLDNIRKGALLHDIGKIAIPDSILKKPAHLTREEWEKIKLHPTVGFGLIKEIKMVDEVGHIVLYHHERFDGAGYPKGLKKEEIPLEARIFALADALDAITSHRPYRKERDFKVARKEILANRGTQFDPKAVEAFDSFGLERWEKLRYETTKVLSVPDY